MHPALEKMQNPSPARYHSGPPSTPDHADAEARSCKTVSGAAIANNDAVVPERARDTGSRKVQKNDRIGQVAQARNRPCPCSYRLPQIDDMPSRNTGCPPFGMNQIAQFRTTCQLQKNR